MTLEEKKLAIFDNYLGALVDDCEMEHDECVEHARSFTEALTPKEIEEEYKDMTG